MGKLETLVFAFRNAIEAAKANHETGYFFENFPTGQCGHTSDMLAQFLIDNGIGPVQYFNGTYYGEDENERQSHTWLLVNSLIVDITADQFRYCSNSLKNDTPVYIGPMNAYYQIFELAPGTGHVHIGLERQWTNYYELRKWYRTILSYMQL